WRALAGSYEPHWMEVRPAGSVTKWVRAKACSDEAEKHGRHCGHPFHPMLVCFSLGVSRGTAEWRCCRVPRAFWCRASTGALMLHFENRAATAGATVAAAAAAIVCRAV